MTTIIYGPGDYTDSIGGVLACHKLAHNLALLGHDSYVVCNHVNVEYRAKAIALEDAAKLAQKDDTLVIYPEIVNGNPLGGKKVMRWILNIPGLLAGDETTYGKDDLYFQYSKNFVVKFPERIRGQLIAVEQHLDLFNNTYSLRRGSCFTVRKGHYKVQDKHPNDSINIGTVGVNNFSGLAKLFNSVQTFICYDHATYTAVSAALCGCLTIVIPDNSLTTEQWHEGFPFFKYGIAYGIADIPYALDTMHLVRPFLKHVEEETMEQTKTMMALFQ